MVLDDCEVCIAAVPNDEAAPSSSSRWWSPPRRRRPGGAAACRQRLRLLCFGLAAVAAAACALHSASRSAEGTDAVQLIEVAKDGHKMPALPRDLAAYLWWPLIFYMFCVMSLVCDDHLVPTVDVICNHFRIPEDVAGATLVAFACNGPELLTNVCGIFITKTSVGMGTIVGSAIFNVLCITGACALVAPKGELAVCKRYFLRDVAFSAISILLLWWALPVIDLLRASVLFGMAAVYVFVVYKSETWLGVEASSSSSSEPMLLAAAAEPKVVLGDVETAAEGLFSQALDGIFNTCLMPAAIVLNLTVPDIKPGQWDEVKSGMQHSIRMAAAFLISMSWLSVTAYVVCIGSDVINKYWGVSQEFLGLTLVAVGTSWPNLMASVITAREGRGAIAVSNALGSNVQNVFLVLAGPLWVSVVANGSYIANGQGILSSVVWMGLSLFVAAAVVVVDNFRLRKWAGKLCIVVYCAYLVQAALL